MRKPQITVTIDPEIKERLQLIAEKDQRSLSSQIQVIIKQYLKENPIKDKK